MTLSLLAARALVDATISADRARMRVLKPSQKEAQLAFLRAIQALQQGDVL